MLAGGWEWTVLSPSQQLSQKRLVPKPPFELRILGPTELHGPQFEGTDTLLRQSKRLALLAYLTVSTAEGFRRRDQVIAYFWPDLDQAQSRTYLRKALYGIREALGQDVFLLRGEDEVRVDPAMVWCDAVTLGQQVREGRWSEALTLYRGELLEGLFPEGVAQEFQDWLSTQRKQLRELAAQAAWECSRLEEDRGDRTAAAVMARRARELDPDNEEGVRRLMGLLDRRGDRGRALRVYSEWQERLLEEFGVEPAPETRKLARQVQAARKGESHETPPVAPPVAGPAPDRDVELLSSSPERPSKNPSHVGAGRRWLLLGVLAVAASTLLVTIALRPTSRAGFGQGSVAVLPLRAIGELELQDVGALIGEEITTRLALDTALVVRIAPPIDEGGYPLDLSALGRQMGVEYIVDGGIRDGSGKVRITIRLVRSIDAVVVWVGQSDIEKGALSEGAQRLASELADALSKRGA